MLLDKWKSIGIIAFVRQRTQRVCVMVAHRTLTPFVRVRILHPLPKGTSERKCLFCVVAPVNFGWRSCCGYDIIEETAAGEAHG